MKIGELELHDEDLVTHIRIMGESGTGKSTLLYSVLTQLIMDGAGFALLDPHGELYQQLLAFLVYTEYRSSDVHLMDATQRTVTATVNPFSSESEPDAIETKAQVLTDLTLQVWGKDSEAVRAEKVLYVLYVILLEQRRPLAEILDVLANPGVIKNHFARSEWEQLRGKSFLDSVTTRLKPLTHSRIKALTNPNQAIDFSRLMNEKIFLANLSRSDIMGEKECQTLSAFLVAEIWAAAFARRQRFPPFYLVVDEFKVLATEELANVLTQAQKFGLHLIFLHQTESQLPSYMRDAIGNVSCFVRFIGKGEVEVHGWGTGVTNTYFEPEPPVHASPTLDEAIKRYCEAVAIQPKAELANPPDRPEADVASRVPVPMPPLVVAQPSPTLTTRRSEEVEDSPTNGTVRGGAFHQSIQNGIRSVAETHGFKVETEKAIEAGGYVDVSLERGALRIACEVSVTTSASWEVKNVQKCLNAGYDHVWVVASYPKNIRGLIAVIHSVIPASEQGKIKVLTQPDCYGELKKLVSPVGQSRKKSGSTAQRMRIPDAAGFFGVSDSTIRRLVSAGKIPHYRIGRTIFFDREELITFGRHSLSDRRRFRVDLEPVKIEKTKSKTKTKENERYRKLMNPD